MATNNNVRAGKGNSHGGKVEVFKKIVAQVDPQYEELAIKGFRKYTVAYRSQQDGVFVEGDRQHINLVSHVLDLFITDPDNSPKCSLDELKADDDSSTEAEDIPDYVPRAKQMSDLEQMDHSPNRFTARRDSQLDKSEEFDEEDTSSFRDDSIAERESSFKSPTPEEPGEASQQRDWNSGKDQHLTNVWQSGQNSESSGASRLAQGSENKRGWEQAKSKRTSKIDSQTQAQDDSLNRSSTSNSETNRQGRTESASQKTAAGGRTGSKETSGKGRGRGQTLGKLLANPQSQSDSSSHNGQELYTAAGGRNGSREASGKGKGRDQPVAERLASAGNSRPSKRPVMTELKGLDPGVVFHMWRVNDSMKRDIQLKWSDQNRQVTVRINDKDKDNFMKSYSYNSSVLVSASLDVGRVCSNHVASIIQRRHSMVQDLSILIQDTRMVFIGSQYCIDRDLPSVENEIYGSDCMPTCVCQQTGRHGGSFVAGYDHVTKWLEAFTEFLPTADETSIDEAEEAIEGAVGGTPSDDQKQELEYSDFSHPPERGSSGEGPERRSRRKGNRNSNAETPEQPESDVMNNIPAESPPCLIKAETYKLKAKLELCIENTDLFNTDVEAILCFTNEKKTGGMVMKKALSMAGARLEYTINKLKKSFSKDQVIHLKCKGFKYIIISMCVTGDMDPSRLNRSIRKLMEKVRTMSLSTVALPLLGAGRLKLLPKVATREILSALMSDRPGSVKRVHLVSTDAEIVREMNQVVNDEMFRMMTGKKH